MRTIKFRAWDIKRQIMMYDVQNAYDTLSFAHITDKDGNDIEYHEACFRDYLGPESDEFKIMQFTGLTDKAGKDIYESDIYKWRDKEIGQIIFADACFDCASDRGRWSLRSMASDLEIIGNLFENPSLLD